MRLEHSRLSNSPQSFARDQHPLEDYTCMQPLRHTHISLLLLLLRNLRHESLAFDS